MARSTPLAVVVVARVLWVLMLGQTELHQQEVLEAQALQVL